MTDDMIRKASETIQHRMDTPGHMYDDAGEPYSFAESIARDLARAGMLKAPPRVIDCDDHKPKQHRDNMPPWCNKCGLTFTGVKPSPRAGWPGHRWDGDQ